MSNEEHLVENIFGVVKRRSPHGVGAFGVDYLYEEDMTDEFIKENGLDWLMSNGDLTISKETLCHLINMAAYMLYHLNGIYEEIRKEFLKED